MGAGMRVEPVDDVLVHEEGGDAFLLHVGSGKYFGLNRSGLVIWGAVAAGADPAEALRARWPDLPVERCEADAAALVAALLDAGLVRAVGTGAGE